MNGCSSLQFIESIRLYQICSWMLLLSSSLGCCWGHRCCHAQLHGLFFLFLSVSRLEESGRQPISIGRRRMRLGRREKDSRQAGRQAQESTPGQPEHCLLYDKNYTQRLFVVLGTFQQLQVTLPVQCRQYCTQGPHLGNWVPLMHALFECSQFYKHNTDSGVVEAYLGRRRACR